MSRNGNYLSENVANVLTAYRAWKSGSATFTDLESALDALAAGKPPEVPKPLTISQAAKVLGMAPASVYKLFDSGKIQGWRVGWERKIDPGELRRYMATAGIPAERLDALLMGR